MLAQNFKTADELGIHERMYQALIKVLGLLEREEIPARLFTMKKVGHPQYAEGPCGTSGCLLGWARAVDEGITDERCITRPTAKLGFLFYPHIIEAFDANREESATVLRAYLSTGRVQWKKVMCNEEA